jgi:hypothetical protein
MVGISDVVENDSLGIESGILGPGSIPPRATKIQIMPCFVWGIFF